MTGFPDKKTKRKTKRNDTAKKKPLMLSWLVRDGPSFSFFEGGGMVWAIANTAKSADKRNIVQV